MNKPLIIALVGPSGCGKTTLSLYLQKRLAIPSICSYTTRPMREGEQNGREHWFVEECNVDHNEMLAYTFFGGNHYWTTTSQIDNLSVCTYVIDEKGLIELEERWGNRYDVLSVYIHRTNLTDIDNQRKDRDADRIDYGMENYDVILHNDSDLKSFLKTAIRQITIAALDK